MTDGTGDDDELKRRNAELAKEILETLKNQPEMSPERAAYEAQKELEDKAALEDYYRRTGQTSDKTARARSATEMTFAASLEACPSCRTWEQPKFDLEGSGTQWSVSGACPRCRTMRRYAWMTEAHPNEAKVLPWQIGDERASAIIRPGQFIAELDRIFPLIRDPEKLQPIEWRPSLATLGRAITALYELMKFVPGNMQVIPDTFLSDDERKDRGARRERFRRPWMQSELDRLLALQKRYEDDAPRIWALEKTAAPVAALGSIDRAALEAHEKWVRAGKRGAGRLDITGAGASGLRLAGVLFEGARLERVNFEKAYLDGARMMDCELTDIAAREANFSSVNFKGAKIIGGTFAGALMQLAEFIDTVVDETSFESANFDRSEWRGAAVTAASFDQAIMGNTWFDGGTFRGCTFRKADLRAITPAIKATTSGAVFEDCDLRFTKWDGRDVSDAKFIRCKLHGITGKPTAMTNVVIEDPDMSIDGNGSNIGEAADVLALWR